MIEIRIEELLLEGFGAVDRDAMVQAIERRLGAARWEIGGPGAFERLDGGAFLAGRGSRAAGEAIADRVFEAVQAAVEGR